MMHNSPEKLDFPETGGDLLRIHSVITSALRISREQSEGIGERGQDPDPNFSGYTTYVESLMTLLDVHHRTEDEQSFPYIREKMPDAPVDDLMAQHQAMIPIMGEIKLGIGKVQPADKEGLMALSEHFKSLEGIWGPHIQVEEKYIGPEGLSKIIDMDERIRLGKEHSKFARENSGPAALILPFIMYNLPTDERKVFAKSVPWFLTHFLVPIVWKRRWSPMASLFAHPP